MSGFYTPGRQLRKVLSRSGQSCPRCGLRLHHTQIVAYNDDVRVHFLHPACVSLLLEMAAADAPEEDGASAATAERDALDAGDSIVPDCAEEAL